LNTEIVFREYPDIPSAALPGAVKFVAPSWSVVPAASQPGATYALALAKAPGLSEGDPRKEKPMEEAERRDNEKSELRAKLDAAVEKAKVVCDRLQEQTTAAASAADRTLREYPYHAIGVAFGLGILIGVLVSRSRSD
jgi:ElaB/YqjD/DUF883 family membrane-anchored ribosome-binding protein